MNPSVQRGVAAARAGQTGEAVQWFRRAVEADPNDGFARAWLGQSLCAIGLRLEGVAELDRAAGALSAGPNPDMAKTYEVLKQLQQWGAAVQALPHARRAAQAHPHDIQAQLILATCHGQLNQTDEALSAARVAADLAPDPMIQVLTASLEADARAFAGAETRLRAVLAATPGPLETYRARKELARVLDALGRYDEAFAELQAASAIVPAVPGLKRPDAELVYQMIAVNRLTYDHELLKTWVGHDFADRGAPALIIGFFRSGTTLTQEVLAAHPDAFVADEAGLVYELQKELQRIAPAQVLLPQKLKALSVEQVAHLRRHYWVLARNRYGDAVDAPRFIEKFTMSTIDIGFINFLFPDAKAVFMVRDPRDVILSCFMQLMPPSQASSQLLVWDEAAEFYAEVMDWWIEIRPKLTMGWMEVRYEDAVADFQGAYSRVLEFLGLDWRDELQDFYRQAQGKFISTPSRGQVAQPIYATSVERWRRYEARFPQVADLLDPFIEAFGYRPT